MLEFSGLRRKTKKKETIHPSRSLFKEVVLVSRFSWNALTLYTQRFSNKLSSLWLHFGSFFGPFGCPEGGPGPYIEAGRRPDASGRGPGGSQEPLGSEVPQKGFRRTRGGPFLVFSDLPGVPPGTFWVLFWTIFGHFLSIVFGEAVFTLF